MNPLPEVTAVVLHFGSPAVTQRCLEGLAASRYRGSPRWWSTTRRRRRGGSPA
ncbi:MAG: hypothetical protein U0802_14795 [Candidatus Binatia bacterium]